MFKPNEIKIDEDEKTTEEIEQLLSTIPRVLVIVDEKDKRPYGESDRLLREKPYYDFLKCELPNILSVSFSKFFYLVLQGYLKKEMFDIVIIRSLCLKREFGVVFKYFYFDCAGSQKPRIVAYLKTIHEIDSIIIQSFRPLERPRNKVREIVFHPNHIDGVEEYARLVALVKHESSNTPMLSNLLHKIKSMETCSFVESMMYMRRMVKLDGYGMHFDECVDSSRLEKLLVNEWKYRQLLLMIASEVVFLMTENKGMFEVISSDRLLDIEAMDSFFIEQKSKDSLLVVYEECDIESRLSIFELPFKEIVFFHGKNDSQLSFIKVLLIKETARYEGLKEAEVQGSRGLTDTAACISKDDEDNVQKEEEKDTRGQNKTEFCVDARKLDAFIEYSNSFSREYRIGRDGAVVCNVFSAQLLTHFLYLVEKVFEENLLFLRNVKISRKYTVTDARMFVCGITLPPIHEGRVFNSEHKGGAFPNKRLALADASRMVMKRIYSAGLCDEHFFPNSREFTTDNKLFHGFIADVYKTSDTSPENIKRIKNEFLEKNCQEDLPESQAMCEFIKEYRLYLDQPDGMKKQIETIYREQPACMKKYPKTYYGYVFNGERNGVGLLTGPSFEESAMFKGICVDFLGKFEFTEAQLEMIIFYQVVFFSVNFRRINPTTENSRRYCYLVVPVKNMEIDFGLLKELSTCFIKTSVYENTDLDILKTNLIFDPFFCVYYSYYGPSTKSILSPMGEDGKSYLKYFEKKYNVSLVHETDDPRLMFEGCLVSKKGLGGTPVALSSEIVHVTSVNREMLEHYRKFIENFYAFESIALAYEFKKSLNLEISLNGICIAFSAKGEKLTGRDYVDYERAEFLGDSVLKYATSKQLFLNVHSRMETIAATKDRIVNNSNLHKQANVIGLQKYFSVQGFSENLFQPPDITLLDVGHSFNAKVAEYIDHFNCERIFKNNNQHAFAINTIVKQSEDEISSIGKKTYADVVEALVGICFLELGFSGASRFIGNLGLLESDSKSRYTEPYVYDGVLEHSDLHDIECAIGYKFKEVGWLEKAVIHPSFSNNVFGAERFQKLELLGDCTMDVLVTKHIYLQYPKLDPSGLHNVRKSLVNNHTFARVLFSTGLASMCKTGFSPEEMKEAQRNLEGLGKASKIFSDLFEAVAGAVIADCGFDLNEFETFFSSILGHLVECSFEC